MLAVETVGACEVCHVRLGELIWTDLKRNPPDVEELSGLEYVLVGILVDFWRLLELLRLFVKDRSVYNLNNGLRLNLLLVFSTGSILIDQRVQETVILCNK